MYQFNDNIFDVVYVSLFFHHFIGKFDMFLNEIYRVLKPGGYIFILEPSILYPFSWITRSLKTIIGNITGQVEDEAPFLPLRMILALKRCKYKCVSLCGASYSHNRFPIPLQNFINKITKFILYIPIINNFCWMCIFSAKK
jgi:SAM-dependent methyltransferase